MAGDLLDKLYLKARQPGSYQVKQVERDHFYWSSAWRKLRDEVLIRDNNECQVCKDFGRVTLDKLIVHHILPLENHWDKRLDASNLVTVCIECHNAIHFGLHLPSKWDDEWY
ncbi:HNH endonuclease [Hutsoniella sourekii]|uniref:HNH endonuclease n=1 Tax=Hutsoniella sourekii TaxID=87650 RepID=UPI0004AFBA54|nr:HNH endonuclease [Hutsoniella sourekii]